MSFICEVTLFIFCFGGKHKNMEILCFLAMGRKIWDVSIMAWLGRKQLDSISWQYIHTWRLSKYWQFSDFRMRTWLDWAGNNWNENMHSCTLILKRYASNCICCMHEIFSVLLPSGGSFVVSLGTKQCWLRIVASWFLEVLLLNLHHWLPSTHQLFGFKASAAGRIVFWCDLSCTVEYCPPYGQFRFSNYSFMCNGEVAMSKPGHSKLACTGIILCRHLTM